MPPLRYALAIAGLLCVLIALVFAQVSQHEFVSWDDADYLYKNPHIQTGLTGETIGWAFTTGHAGNWHPLTWISHTIDWSLFGDDAGKHHLVNVGLHAVNSVLLFLALLALVDVGAGSKQPPPVWRAGLVAVLFAVHPLHVESVAWASERKDVLCALFWMCTLLAYARHARQPSWPRLAIVGLCLALALLSKPMAVTLPAVLLLLDWWPLARMERWVKPRKRPWTARELVIEKLPLAALVLVSSLLTLRMQSAQGAVASTEVMSLPARLGNAIVAYVDYLRLTFWPDALCYFYPLELPETSGGGYWPKVGACALLLIVITALAVYFGRTRRYLLVGGLWYVGTLVPVIGLVQVGSQHMADRYTYLPLVGIFIIFAWGGAELVAAIPRLRIPAGIAAAVIVAACAWKAWLQTATWATSEVLFTHALEVTEENYHAVTALDQVELDQARDDEAAARRNAHARAALAQVRLDQDRNEEALALLLDAVETNPTSAVAQHRLGIALAEPPRNDWEGARPHFEAAARLDPKKMEIRVGLARVLALLGELTLARDQYDVARQLGGFSPYQAEYDQLLLQIAGQQATIAEAQSAVQAAPREPIPYCKLGSALSRAHRFAEAQSAFEQALAIDPKCFAARLAWASMAETQRKYDVVAQQYREAMKLAPNDGALANNLAWLLATCRDEKVRSGSQALELLKPWSATTFAQSWGYLDTLAAAYAAAGNFKQAVVSVDQALAAAKNGKEQSVIAEMEARRELYRREQAYYE